ncbi:MAG: hypothetical protein ACFB8W_06235 [Elainellaceae cyanobacterium]
MAYDQFTLKKVVQAFDLKIVEGDRLFPEIEPTAPSPLLQDLLSENLPWAEAVSSEKARSEAIINPILLEVRRICDRQISVFSGEDFTVDPAAGLTGRCDFLISKSPEQLFIQAPAVVIVEAKKEDTKAGLGQCIAEMVAAQRFNLEAQQPIPAIYGSVSSGTAWKFLKLQDGTVTIDLKDYPLLPVEMILGRLVWMVRQG